MSNKLGITAKLYLNEASYDTPTWGEVVIISDFSVNPTWEEGDASDRETRVKLFAKTMLGLEFSGRLKNKPGDEHYETLMDAMDSDDVLDVLVLDGDIEEESRGYRCDVQVFAANEDQGMGNVLFKDIVLKPTPSDHKPKAVKAHTTTNGETEYLPIATDAEDE